MRKIKIILYHLCQDGGGIHTSKDVFRKNYKYSNSAFHECLLSVLRKRLLLGFAAIACLWIIFLPEQK